LETHGRRSTVRPPSVVDVNNDGISECDQLVRQAIPTARHLGDMRRSHGIGARTSDAGDGRSAERRSSYGARETGDESHPVGALMATTGAA
jgi:hypothetical protein